MSRGWISVGLAVSLAGCVHYAPAPLSPDRFPAELDARRLDDRPAGVVWNNADLLTQALARNTQIAEAQAKYATAMAAARTAGLSPGLTLTLTAEYADEAPRLGGGGSADIPVVGGVRRNARTTTADLQALQAWYDYGEAVWSVRTALARAGIDLQSALEEAALAAKAVDLRGERLDRLERRVAAGEDDRAPALIARTELSAAQRRLSEAQARQGLARLDLARALGVGPNAVSGVALAPTRDPPGLDGLSDWRRDATRSRGDVLRAISDYDLAETALRLEVVRQYPEVRIAPGYTYDHGVNKLPVSLSLALPAYDLNQRAIQQAEAARTAAGRSLELLQANILADVDGAVGALATARTTVDRTMAQDLPAARRTAESTARAVGLGAADRVDDLAARAAVVDVELGLVDARRARARAAVDLEDALRRAFDPAEAGVLQRSMTRPGGRP